MPTFALPAAGRTAPPASASSREPASPWPLCAQIRPERRSRLRRAIATTGSARRPAQVAAGCTPARVRANTRHTIGFRVRANTPNPGGHRGSRCCGCGRTPAWDVLTWGRCGPRNAHPRARPAVDRGLVRVRSAAACPKAAPAQPEARRGERWASHVARILSWHSRHHAATARIPANRLALRPAVPPARRAGLPERAVAVCCLCWWRRAACATWCSLLAHGLRECGRLCLGVIYGTARAARPTSNPTDLRRRTGRGSASVRAL
eukprot:scaffold140_cov565-Prasinococcus_capsulatus_cf.AAC.18